MLPKNGEERGQAPFFRDKRDVVEHLYKKEPVPFQSVKKMRNVAEER
jgi:hypothetical protein